MERARRISFGMTSFGIKNCYCYQFLMPNGATSYMVYPEFDINDNNQGREGLRGNFPLLSIWGGRGVDGKQFFLEGKGGGWPPKKKEGYPSLTTSDYCVTHSVNSPTRRYVLP